MASSIEAKRGWVFGPGPDLLLGCGLGYLLLAGSASLLPIDRSDLVLWGGILVGLVGMPHYGATLLRVYQRPEDRRRYAIFGIWASLLVWGAFVWGVYDVLVGSVLLTIYLTWSPWHYTGQNYGLCVMFLRRAGFGLDALTKRLLYSSFLLSYAMGFLVIHSEPDTLGYGPVVMGWVYEFLPLGIPVSIYAVLFSLVLTAYLLVLAAVLVRLRDVEGQALVPVLSLITTQALWISLPSVSLWATGRAAGGVHVAFMFMWAAIGHGVQYLWITSWYSVGKGPTGDRMRFLGKALFAGAAIWAVPALVFSPSLLGETSYMLGLFSLVASAVNLHHFVLDGAIWKLRDGPVARILLAPADPERAKPSAPESSGTGASLLVAVGVLSLVVTLGGSTLHAFGWHPAVTTRDATRAERVERWLGWLGRDEPAFWNRRASLRLEAGDPTAALALYEESLRLTPNPNAWSGIARVRQARGDVGGALKALHHSVSLRATANAWLDIADIESDRGDRDAALGAYEEALRAAPDDHRALERFGNFLVAMGDRDRGRELLARAEAAHSRSTSR
jgi:cytochrome c-type biogenesis protein CcmH/NrfG